jgi:myo-inositol-1(or 4)-monophosphatase
MLKLAIRAAREAGHILAEKYNQPHKINIKGFRDISTEADLAAEALALRIIREGCPGARVVSEESNSAWQESSDGPIWYVDPLDGTTNYARGLPTFSISVAMARGGRVECGAVYDPLLEQLFYTERGGGAYLNDQKLHVSSRSTLIECLLLLDWPRVPEKREAAVRLLSRLAPQVDAVRSRGSAALAFCSIAAGWADIYYQFTLGPWDVAAGALLVEEAGGKVTNLRGEPYALNQPDWLVTNGLVHEAVLAAKPYG